MTTPVHFHLEDRVAIVTGAAQGIGAACADRLAADGAAVALWDVDDARGSELAKRLAAGGARAHYVHCNVARKSEVDAALAETIAALGPVNALINNAGIFKAADFLEITEADWDAVIDVNLKGSFLVAQAVAIVPGATALTRMPLSASASAITRVSWLMPPLLTL